MNIDAKPSFDSNNKEFNYFNKIVETVDKNIALTKIPTRELLERCKLIDQSIVHEIGQHFHDVYGAPEESLDRLDAYKAYVVPEELYFRLAYSEIVMPLFKGKENIRDLKGEDLTICLKLLKAAEGSAGVCDTKRKRWIVRENIDQIKEYMTFRHESLHAMADFDDVRSGFQTGEDYDSHSVNEAVVEILERADYLKKVPDTLMSDILDGKLKFVETRKKNILLTLIPLYILQGTEDEISFRDLAKYYWKGDIDGYLEILEPKVEKNMTKVGEEKMKLIKRAYEALK